MTYHNVIQAALIVLMGQITACAMRGPAPEQTACGSDYHCIKDLMFQYRQQAAHLNALADRYTRQADLKAQELGSTSDAAKASQDLAKRFSLQAQEADQLAREYQRQLPHNDY